MNKEQIKSLQTLAEETLANVLLAIKTLTAENPLVLFNKETAQEDYEDDNELDTLPYGYTVGKYNTYYQGAIQKVEGDKVTIFMTGEEFGDTFTLELYQLPYESLIQLLNYLEERATI